MTMAKSNMNARVVVNKRYFELLSRKADLLDNALNESGVGSSIIVDIVMLKEGDKLAKEWDKLQWDVDLDVEDYVEPKPSAPSSDSELEAAAEKPAPRKSTRKKKSRA